MNEETRAVYRSLSRAIFNDESDRLKAILDQHPTLDCTAHVFRRDTTAFRRLEHRTPMSAAIQEGSLEVIDVLLTTQRVQVNASFQHAGATMAPLDLALWMLLSGPGNLNKKISPRLLDLLLQHGANPLRDTHGNVEESFLFGHPLHNLVEAFKAGCCIRNPDDDRLSPAWRLALAKKGPETMLWIQHFVQGLVHFPRASECFTILHGSNPVITGQRTTVLDILWPGHLPAYIENDCYLAMVNNNSNDVGQDRQQQQASDLEYSCLNVNDAQENNPQRIAQVRRMLLKGYAQALVQQHHGAPRPALRAVLSQLVAEEEENNVDDSDSYCFCQLEVGILCRGELQALLVFIIAFGCSSEESAATTTVDQDDDLYNKNDTNSNLVYDGLQRRQQSQQQQRQHDGILSLLPNESTTTRLLQLHLTAVQEVLQRPWLVASMLNLEVDLIYKLVRNFAAATVQLT